MSVRILEGDCLSVMPTLEACSVDAIVTDPPYGLHFMGKAWDKFGSSIGVDHNETTERSGSMHAGKYDGRRDREFEEFMCLAFAHALRLAKPGAHLVAFGAPKRYHRLACAAEDAGWEIRDSLMWLFGSGFPKSHNRKGKWQGWSTALKPAYEPIILARKPLIRGWTVGATLDQWGTSSLNVDATRVDGRWPANVVLDADSGALLDEQSGQLQSNSGNLRELPGRKVNTYGEYGTRSDKGRTDSGGASRFYYCAKSSRTERGETNNHPTVKPLALMRWLCRLVTPPGGLILDPFTGSGSTGVAARQEGFRFLGVEQSPEYAEMARKRIADDSPLFGDVA